MDKTPSLDAICLNLHIIRTCLAQASQEIKCALAAADKGHQNRAIGHMLEVPDRLESAKTLCDAILRIHRNSRTS